MTISELIKRGATELESARIQCADPTQHMYQILEHVLQVHRTELIVRAAETLLLDKEMVALEILERRKQGEPFQYIVGHEWFWDSCYKVGPGVLIPRRETENLVETVLNRSPKEKQVGVELGAGSGNIGITLLQERPAWQWHAFEINPDSVPYANQNRQALLPDSANYHLYEEDFFTGISRLAPVDLIVANPPYVPREELGGLAKEVQQEPRKALDGGDAGAEILAELISVAKSILNSKGALFLEIDPRQVGSLKERAAEIGFKRIEVVEDYSGFDRVFVARKG